MRETFIDTIEGLSDAELRKRFRHKGPFSKSSAGRERRDERRRVRSGKSGI